MSPSLVSSLNAQNIIGSFEGLGINVIQNFDAVPNNCFIWRRQRKHMFDIEKQMWIPTSNPVVLDENYLVMILNGFQLLETIRKDPNKIPSLLSARVNGRNREPILIIENFGAVKLQEKKEHRKVFPHTKLVPSPTNEEKQIRVAQINDLLANWTIYFHIRVVMSKDRTETITILKHAACEIGAMPYR
jgi:hypothetical protein